MSSKSYHYYSVANGYTTNDNDLLKGTDRNDIRDFIDAGDGNDTIYGLAGADSIVGGKGDDQLFGGNDWDRLFGGDGNDLLDGGLSGDRLFGEDGDDTLLGGNGNDGLEGGEGNDIIDAGSGQNTASGGLGDDIITNGRNIGYNLFYGNEGNDVIEGGLWKDTLYGNEGNDTLRGHEGDDQLFGGDGNDQLTGGNGHDTLEGGKGADTLYGHDGNDLLKGGEGNDQLNGAGGKDTLYGEQGQDILIGGEWGDTMYGGEDADTLNGYAGKDFLDGGDGDDILNGGIDDDTVLGGAGNDTIYAGMMDTSIDGGADEDVLVFTLYDDNAFVADLSYMQNVTGMEVIRFADERTTSKEAVKLILSKELLETTENTVAIDARDIKLFLNVSDLKSADTVHVYSNTIADVTVVPDEIQATVVVHTHNDSRLSVFAGSRSQTIDGSENGDQFFLNRIGELEVDGTILDTKITINADNGNDYIFLGKRGVVEVNAGEGDDSIVNIGETQATVHGGKGNDRFYITGSEAVSYGDEGDDILIALYVGKDMFIQAFGGEGNDILSGSIGNDILEGGEGNDELVGENGDDSLNGGEGQNTINGGEGNDTIAAGVIEINTIDGGEGEDTLLFALNDDYTFLASLTYMQNVSNIETIQFVDERITSTGQATLELSASLLESIGHTLSINAHDIDLLLNISDLTSQDTVHIYNSTLEDIEVIPQDIDATVVVHSNDMDGIIVFAGSRSQTIGGTENDDIFYLGENGILEINGGAGDDTFFNVGATEATVSGGGGNDTFYIVGKQAIMQGGTGDDVFIAQTIDVNWASAVFGDEGTDKVELHGEDIVLDSTFNWIVNGVEILQDGMHAGNIQAGTSPHAMNIQGLDGDDSIAGTDFNDTLEGGKGDDDLLGGNGDDIIYGNRDNDRLLGFTGNDKLYGGLGEDILFGGEGNDTLFGATHDDTLAGGEGDDVIEGGEGYNFTEGNSGNDTFILQAKGDSFNDIYNFDLGQQPNTGGIPIDKDHVSIEKSHAKDEIIVRHINTDINYDNNFVITNINELVNVVQQQATAITTATRGVVVLVDNNDETALIAYDTDFSDASSDASLIGLITYNNSTVGAGIDESYFSLV